MSELARANRGECLCGAVLMVLAAGACEGTLDADPVQSTASELGGRKHNLAKMFRVLVRGAMTIETRSGQIIEVPIDHVEVEVFQSESDSEATPTRGRAPAIDVTIPPTPTRRSGPPAVEQPTTTCTGTPTRGQTPVVDVGVPPEVPPENVPRRVGLPAMEVMPTGDTTATPRRVSVPPIEQPVPPPPDGNGPRSKRKAGQKVITPRITIGLLDPDGPLQPSQVFVEVPEEATDGARFVRIRTKH
jgi:hypothetical protein